MPSLGLIETLKNPGSRIIVHESDEEMIRRIQHALRLMGRMIAVDGEFGPITAGAIKSVNNRALHGIIWDLMTRPPLPNDGVPAWTRIALEEYAKGIREIPGPMDNPEIVKYWKAFRQTKWIDDDETPWCAIAQGWCLKEAGVPDALPSNPASALAYLEFGEKIDEPCFGCLGIKRRYRNGKVIGGHIGQVVGADYKRQIIYLLGGNQGNMWSVREYPMGIFEWCKPRGYTPSRKLGYWNGVSALAGSEV